MSTDAESNDGVGRSWPPIDLDRLTPLERELWDRYCEPEPGPESNEGPGTVVWGFAQICMIEGTGVPDVAHEYLEETRVGEYLNQYLENMRRARIEGRLKKPAGPNGETGGPAESHGS